MPRRLSTLERESQREGEQLSVIRRQGQTADTYPLTTVPCPLNCWARRTVPGTLYLDSSV